MLLEICGGKYAKYSALCAVWATTTTAGLVTGNPALIAVGLEAGTLDTPSGQITLGLPRGGEWQPKSGPKG